MTSGKEKDEWMEGVFTTLPPEKHEDEREEDSEPPDGEEAEMRAEPEPDPPTPVLLKPHAAPKDKRSMAECEGLVKGIDDETVGLLLIAVAKEAIVRGIDPTISIASTTKVAPGGRPMVNQNDLWGRVVQRLDRSKRGGYRFDGSPIFGRAILGRELSNVGVGEDGKAAPVVFGRKDMRGTLWLAVGEKGATLDMAGTPIAGMKLLCMSSSSDEFEKLCDAVEALLSGVETKKVEDRRTTEQKLASLDDWE